MNFSWKFIFDTTGYVVKALPLTLFLTIFPVAADWFLDFYWRWQRFIRYRC